MQQRCFILLLALAFSPVHLLAQLNDYLGVYRQKSDSSVSLAVKLYNSRLQLAVPAHQPQWLVAAGDGSFRVQDSLPVATLRFERDKQNEVSGLTLSQNEQHSAWTKKIGLAEDASLITRYGNRDNGFSRSDTLRGMLSPLRSCYDVTFYHLDVTIDTLHHSLQGHNLIRFKAMNNFDRLQIDLFANMTIEKIMFRNRPLAFTREFDAVYVQFPQTIRKDASEEIVVYYHGKPQVPDFSIPMTGGIFWSRDDKNQFWMEVVCQGSGASLWWPNKDHLSDEPDSMRISITVPRGVEEISNGRLLSRENVAGNQTRYNWLVSYPINNYNVTVNMGDYVHFNDTLIRKTDTLAIHYHCLRQHLQQAKDLFSHVKPMLRLYEQDFGPYPFPRDGLTLMESIYPMEHQGAVSVGKLDEKNFHLETMWHECAHEWWGNNVSVKDFADFWIHEGFADYAAALVARQQLSPVVATMYYKSLHPANKQPVIGVRDVNHFFYNLDDVYSKGSLMLNTLQHVVNNDSLWFAILRGIQSRFRYQTVTSDDIIQYFNELTHTDYTYFFTQYLQKTDVPELQVQLKQQNDSLQLQYRWVASVPGFHMPVMVTTANRRYNFIYPSQNWQTLTLPGLQAEDFAVAGQDKFYINTSITGRPPVVKPDSALLRQYAGTYELSPKGIFFITVQNGNLYFESKTNSVPKSLLTAKKPNLFSWEITNIDLEFVRDAGGVVKEVIVYEEGKTTHLKKIN